MQNQVPATGSGSSVYTSLFNSWPPLTCTYAMPRKSNKGISRYKEAVLTEYQPGGEGDLTEPEELDLSVGFQNNK